MRFVKNHRSENNFEIVEVYDKLDLELARINPGCDACGTCCHFDTFDHELYASTIEVDYILKNVEVPSLIQNKEYALFWLKRSAQSGNIEHLDVESFSAILIIKTLLKKYITSTIK